MGGRPWADTGRLVHGWALPVASLKSQRGRRRDTAFPPCFSSRHSFHGGICEPCPWGEWQFSKNKKKKKKSCLTHWRGGGRYSSRGRARSWIRR